MAFTYFLPDENGSKEEHGTSSNAVIIIGANGSGKSKLGAWIEQNDFENYKIPVREQKFYRNDSFYMDDDYFYIKINYIFFSFYLF